MEEKLKFRKRKNISLFSSSSRVVMRSRHRLNVNGDRSDRRGAEDLSLDDELLPTAGDGENGAFEGPFVENFSPVASVRDLRVQRIFTPVSIGSLDEMEKDVTDDYSSPEDRAENMDVEIRGFGGWRTEADQHLGRSLDSMCDFVAEKTCDAGVCFQSNVRSLGQNGGSEQLEIVQECVQSTPPDEVLGETKIRDYYEKTNDPHPEGSSEQLPGRRYTTSRIIKPYFRPKFFGNSSSFNYRRLLPYLMDMTKGALKSLDMKPQLPNNAGSSVVKNSLSTLEFNPSCGNESSSQCQALSPSRTSEPNLICNANTADTEVPSNSFLRDPEECCNLSYGQAKVSTQKNVLLSQSEFRKVAEVLDGMVSGGDGKDANITVSSEDTNGSNCVYSTTQQLACENTSELTHVLGDALSYKCLSLGDVHAAEKNVVNYDKPESNICGKNSAEIQETHPSNEIYGMKYVFGTAKCILKPEDQIEDDFITDKKNSDHKQFVGCEASTTLSSEAISGSNSNDYPTQQSPGEYRSKLKNILVDALSCKHLDLGDVHAAEKKGVDYDKPLSNEEFGRKDVLGTVEFISNSEDQQFIVSADKKPSTFCERKQYLNPRRLKIFKNSNSVSYRRMLPYLTEIFGDSTHTSSEDQVDKVGAAVKGGDYIKKNHSTDTSVRGTTRPGDSKPISAASCVVEPQVMNFERSSELDAVAESSTESQLENRLKSPIDLQIASHGQGPPPIQFPSSSSGPNYLHIGECVEKSQCTAYNFKEEDLPKTKQHSDDSVHPEPINPLGRLFVSPIRGILKRNPPGCRGLCTCLKCASFRLHAEKSFEFSRSQLLDSEEIALELINELALLRNLLKKSTDSDSGKTRQFQVREACRKAHTIEQEAKARFQQMNLDLNIHCQIPNLQRPSVSFVRHFEENCSSAK